MSNSILNNNLGSLTPSLREVVEITGSDASNFSVIPGIVGALRAPTIFYTAGKFEAAAKRVNNQAGLDHIRRQMMGFFLSLPASAYSIVSVVISSAKFFAPSSEFVKLVSTIPAYFPYIFGLISLICCIGETVYQSHGIYLQRKFMKEPLIELLRASQNGTPADRLEVLKKHRSFLSTVVPGNTPVVLSLLNPQSSAREASRTPGFSDPFNALLLTAEPVPTIRAEDSAHLALKGIQKVYFSTTPTERAEMQRIVRQPAYQKIKDLLPSALGQLSSPDREEQLRGLKKASNIFKIIETQSQKQIALHGLRLLAVVIALVTLAVTFAGLPLFALLACVGVSLALTTFTYGFYNGVLDNEGWKFTISTCIPKPIKWIADGVRHLAIFFFQKPIMYPSQGYCSGLIDAVHYSKASF